MTLKLRSLTVRYGEGPNSVTAVDGVDLAVPEGGTLGLVGESGCGKSSIARAVVGLAQVSGGRILVGTNDVTDKRDTASFRRRVQMVFQDPYASLNPRMTINEMIAEVLPRDRFRSAKERATEMLRLLDLVGLPSDALARYPHQFSGGQRQRIAIARALAVGPEVLLLDEVTSALDVSVQATVLNLLKELQQRLRLSFLLISHDLSTVRYMSDAVAVMYLGRVVEVAPKSALFSEARHPYTHALMASIPQVGRPRRRAPLVGDLPDPRTPPQGCRFHTRCPVGPLFRPEREICRTQDPQVLTDQMPHHEACHFPGESGVVPAAPAQALPRPAAT